MACGGEDNRSEELSTEASERLRALGYEAWGEIGEAEEKIVGVTQHDPDRVYKGLNYFCDEPARSLRFMDMKGDVVHSIALDIQSDSDQNSYCGVIEFDTAGGIVTLVETRGLISVDFEGQERWRKKGRFHHDLEITDTGLVVALFDSTEHVIEAFHPSEPIVDAHFVTLSSSGDVIERVSLGEIIATQPGMARRVRNSIRMYSSGPPIEGLDPMDVFHTNSLEIIRRTVEYENGVVFEPGDILVSLSRISRIFVVDSEIGQVKWSWGARALQNQHHASLLPDGNVMIFDNGTGRKYSRVVVVSPATDQVVWQYQAEPVEDFYSRTRGGTQQLPNGNVLITESDNGRVFEVTPDGELVWEFLHTGVKPGARAAIYRMMRLPQEQLPALAFPEAVRQKLRRRGYLAAG